ncbi:hypothetical protein CM15mP43_08640 [bacterium]|nr:MAG: hypothetical protein CM15mP43_08640 [bacterium]
MFGLGILYVYLKTIKSVTSQKISIRKFYLKQLFSLYYFLEFSLYFYQFDYYSINLLEIFLPININEMTFTGYQGLSSHGGIFGLLFSFIFRQKVFILMKN